MMQGIHSGPIFEQRKASILFSNGDAHLRRRQPLARTFAFKLMEGLRPRAAAIAQDLVSERLGAGEIDFLQDVAGEVPARIIAEVLGIPQADLPLFRRLSDKLIQTIGFFEPGRRAELESAVVDFDAYVDGLLADPRRAPRADFLSEFVAAADAAKDLSEDEIRTNIVALIVAGSDTTKNTIAMTLKLLLEREDQWRLMTNDPDGAKKGAAAEGLRYEPVAAGIPRLAVDAFELDGFLITAGQLIVFSIVSACRDEDVYENPHQFELRRTDHPRWHFAFGGGAHRCLGEALARIEIEETLAAVARLAPRSEVRGAPPRMGPGPVRTVDQMRVAFA